MRNGTLVQLSAALKQMLLNFQNQSQHLFML